MKEISFIFLQKQIKNIEFNYFGFLGDVNEDDKSWSFTNNNRIMKIFLDFFFFILMTLQSVFLKLKSKLINTF